MTEQKEIEDFKGEVMRVVEVKDATLIMGIHREHFSNPRKEIRHRLDNQDKNETSGIVKYVDSDYEVKAFGREDILEVVVLGMDLKIAMNKHIPEKNMYSVIRKTLEAPQSVICVGMYDVGENYTRII